MEKQNPGVAAVLSFLFNGLGQIYNGQIAKGLSLMLVSAMTIASMAIGAILIGHYIITDFIYMPELATGAIMLFVGLTSAVILGIYNIYDAYNTARKGSAK